MNCAHTNASFNTRVLIFQIQVVITAETSPFAGYAMDVSINYCLRIVGTLNAMDASMVVGRALVLPAIYVVMAK